MSNGNRSTSRRTVLKQLGAGSVSTVALLTTTSSTATAAREAAPGYSRNNDRPDIAHVKIYNEAETSTTHRYTALSGVKDAFDSLVDQNKIPGYEIEAYDSDFVRNDDSQGAVSEFAEWCNEDYNDFTERGAHLVVHDKSARNPGASGGDAWKSNAYAQVAVNKQSGDDDFQNTVNHELGHLFIDDTVVSDMLSDYGDELNSHELGVIYADSSGRSYETPMGAPGAAGRGECSKQDENRPDSYTQYYWTCTQNAFQATLEDRRPF